MCLSVGGIFCRSLGVAALGQHIQLRHQLGADDREHLLHLVAVLSREALAHTLDDRVQVRIADAVVIDVFLGGAQQNLRKDLTYCNSSWKRSVIKSPSPEAITNNKEMYKVDSPQAEEFIHHEEILETLEYARSHKDNRTFMQRSV